MKNIIYKVGFFILLIILLASVEKVNAWILVPYFDVKIIVNTSGEDTEFSYQMSTRLPGISDPEDLQDILIETEGGTAEHDVSTFVGNDSYIILTQATSSGLSLSSVECESDYDEVSTEPIPGGVKIITDLFTSITCTFTNTMTPEITKNPVVIIPGILSSYLNRNDDEKTEIWPNIIGALFGWPGDRYLDELALNEIGLPDKPFPAIFPSDIFRKISVNDYFGGLIKQLEDGGYVEGKDLFVFPYDWRLDIRNTTLKEKIDEVLQETGAQKVDLVAHSMGGLLAKYYIKHFGVDKVDKFVDIATPHLGAPNAFKTLMYGDDIGIKFGLFGLNPEKIKEISQNMSSGYQLLPSPAYFTDSDPDYAYYVDDLDDIDRNSVKNRLSFDQTKQFLKNTGRNGFLLDTVTNVHADLDDMNPVDNGVRAYNLIGCGTPTVGKFFLLNNQDDDPQYDLAYISGDGTVPKRSAEEFLVMERYYITGQKHASMPSASGIKELTASILNGQIDNFDFDSYKNISTTADDCELPNGTFLSFHSPVAVNIYDSAGNHAGPTEDGDLEQNIPNAAYDIIDENKFVYLPDGESYRVKLQATAEGSFSSHIKKIEDGEIVSTTYFADVPLQSIDTKAEVDISGSIPNIILDSISDGSDEKTILPSGSTNGDIFEDSVPPEFILSVDPNVFELKISGTDNLSKPILTIDKTKYNVIDPAGNMTNMIIETNKENEHKLNYDITFPAILGSKPARMVFERRLDKQGVLKTFTQTVRQGKDAIIYTYNLKKDKTVIRTKEGKEVNRQVFAESKEIEFITNNGVIEIK